MSVSELGLGCAALSGVFGRVDWDVAMRTLHRALDLGVTFLDTSNVYGAGHNEVLVGRGIATSSVPRDQIQLVSKFGIDRSLGRGRAEVHRGEPAYVKRACEESLMRLGVDTIDLYYMHRPPRSNPIEETVGAMAELVTEGKVRYLGLSEVDNDLLRRACVVHPIAAVQVEYSMWHRTPEISVLPAMRELGVALVPYSPLARGYLSGTLSVGSFDDVDVRAKDFETVADKVETMVSGIRIVADRKGKEPAQIALAWVLAQSARFGVPVVPIPGTDRIKWLEQNIAALDISLDADDLAELDRVSNPPVAA
ncbi:MAG: aldo/keto reductase [Actinomycetota bacterium]